MTRLAGNLPKGDGNGLGPIVQQLLSLPHRVHVVVALIDCKTTKIDHETGDMVPTVRVRRIESVLTGDRTTAKRMLERAYEQRSGQTMLPFELEQDMQAAFDGLDIQSGEVTDPEADQ